jgi:hypothetical protein
MQGSKDDMPRQISDSPINQDYPANQAINTIENGIKSFQDARMRVNQMPIYINDKDEDISGSDQNIDDNNKGNSVEASCEAINKILKSNGYMPINIRIYPQYTHMFCVEGLKNTLIDIFDKQKSINEEGFDDISRKLEDALSENRILKDEIMKLQESATREKELTISNVGKEKLKNEDSDIENYERKLEGLQGSNQKCRMELDLARNNVLTLEKELNLYKSRCEDQYKVADELVDN